jgi:hypothetical protein
MALPLRHHAAELFGSIAAYCEGLPNVKLPALQLDASQPDTWPPPPANGLAALITINMTHIAPWAATQGLLKGAGER